MLANDLPVIDGLEVLDIAHADTEMIAPELNHSLIELPLRKGCSEERCILQLSKYRVRFERVQLGTRHDELRVCRCHERSDGAVVDRVVIEMILEVSAEPFRPGELRLLGRKPHRYAAREANLRRSPGLPAGSRRRRRLWQRQHRIARPLARPRSGNHRHRGRRTGGDGSTRPEEVAPRGVPGDADGGSDGRRRHHGGRL